MNNISDIPSHFMCRVETVCNRVIMENPNMLIPYILIAALAYDLGEPVVTDTVYDIWCRAAHRKWDNLHHRHKHLINYDAEGTTVGVTLLPDQYPEETHRSIVSFIGIPSGEMQRITP